MIKYNKTQRTIIQPGTGGGGPLLSACASNKVQPNAYKFVQELYEPPTQTRVTQYC